MGWGWLWNCNRRRMGEECAWKRGRSVSLSISHKVTGEWLIVWNELEMRDFSQMFHRVQVNTVKHVFRAMTTDETPTIEIAFANFNKMASKNVLATSDVSYSCHRLGKSRKQKATKDRERGVSFYKSQGHCKWSFCYIPSSSF